MNSVPQDTPDSNLCPEKTTFIYKLRDPETNEIRYVGKANNPQERLKQHIAHSHNQTKGTHVGYWIASLLRRGLKPLLEIIEEIPLANWQERERYWIEYHLEHGYSLTNTFIGGNGTGMVPEETRLKMSVSRKGKPKGKFSPEHRANISAARKGKPGHPSSPATNAKISAANKGKKRKPFSEEWRRKLGDVSRGKKQSPEHVAKKAAAKRGKKAHPGAGANISLAKKRSNAMKRNPPNASTLWDYSL